METRSGSKLSNKPSSYAAGKFFRFSGAGVKIRNYISRRFDESLFIGVAERIRQQFFRLRMRVLGTFLLTFGIYTFASTILVNLFHGEWTAVENLYCGLILAVLSIPLLMSRGNISTALVSSHFGSVLCDYLGVRRESLQECAFSGRANVAFVLGVLTGMLTLWISPLRIIACFIAAVGIGIIFVLPENGVMALAMLILFAGPLSQLWTILITIVSYLLKLFRGKRSIHFYRRDIFASFVLLSVIGGGMLNVSGTVFSQTGMYVLFLCSYFLAALILYDFRKINRIISALYVGGGVIAVMYLAGFALNHYLTGSMVRDAGFLLRAVWDLPIFKNGLAPTLFMVLIPLAVSGCLHSSPYAVRRTSIICSVTMTFALILCSSGAEVLCTCAAVVLLLILYHKRVGYFILGIILAAVVLLMHLTGALGEQVYIYFAQQVNMLLEGMQKFWSDIMELEVPQFLAGSGFTSTLQYFNQGQGAPGNIYTMYVQSLGWIGFLIFAVFMIVLIGTNLQFYKKTFQEAHTVNAFERFGTVRNLADLRLGGSALLCSVIAALLCGATVPVWQDGVVFVLFGLLLGVGTAYVKSANREIGKAGQAAVSDFGPESAAVTLKRKKED